MFFKKSSKYSTSKMFNDLREDLAINSDSYIETFKIICSEKDSWKLEEILFEGFLNHLFDKKEVIDKILPILCDVLLQDWHQSHENIVEILENIKSLESVEALYQTIYTRYPYDENDEASAFVLARKCIWALGKINTKESYERLKSLTTSDNELIKNEASYVLSQYF